MPKKIVAIAKLHTLFSNPLGVYERYKGKLKRVIVKLKKGIPPIYGEDYDQHWNFTTFKNKVILDLGADYGSTAYYFLRKGASKVVAVEGDTVLASKLKTNSKKFDKIVPIETFIDSSEKIEKLISHYHPDLVKVDIEGYEKLLLNVYNIANVNEWLIEAHTEQLYDSIVKFFLAHGFSTRSFLYLSNKLKIIHAYRQGERQVNEVWAEEHLKTQLSLWQRLVLKINGHVFLRYEKRQGWKGYLPIYLVKCKKHGLYEDYKHGYREYFICPLCLHEAKSNG